VKKNEELPVPSFVSLCCVAPLRFLKLYILKKGFLDGTPGLILCVLSSFHDFYKYAKCWESQRGVSS
jgi:hypothetical protein